LSVGSGRITIIWFTGSEPKPGLYYSTSTDGGTSFSQRRLLDENQSLGKHAQAYPLSGSSVLIAWDQQTKTASCSFLAILDGRTALLHKSERQMPMTYPVLAVVEDLAVVAGLKENRDVVMFAQSVDELRK